MTLTLLACGIMLLSSLVLASGQVQAEMTSEDARNALEKKELEFSQEAFFNSLRLEGKEVIQLFLTAGMDVNSQDEDGNTALMMAVWFSYTEDVEIVRLLLDNGADLNVKDKDGWTALMSARHPVVAQFLIDQGADIHAKTNDGKPVSIVIAFRGRTKVVEVLQQAGLTVDDDAHKQAMTAGILRAIATALGSYLVDVNRFPAAENGPVSAILHKKDDKEGLTENYYTGQMMDLWGTDIMYSSDGETYRLTSFGADKAEGDGSGEFDADIIFANGQLIAPEGLLD